MEQKDLTGSLTQRIPTLRGRGKTEHAGAPVADESSLYRDQTHRRLKNRHIQLIGIGGTIGTLLFVQIGAPLTKGGPGSLFIAFTLWCTFVLAMSNCLSEMVSWIPISSPFARFADRFVDPALGFASGVNFFIYEAALVPFEVVAFNIILHFWTEKIPIAAVIVFILISYALLNLLAVKYYGESEFWLSVGKVILAIGLIIFTFIAMVGGNPLHDAFGFRNWNPSNVPGTPFAEYINTGSLGRFQGFLTCFIQASYTIAGPDYVAMTAGEAESPRRTLPRAFHSVFYRLTTFFVIGSLCVGILVPYSDPNLLSALSNARPGAGSSPYVIAMERLDIPVLPHIVNAFILISVFSAGNSYVFCASRTLLGLALEGKAPRLFARCNRDGVPIYSVGLTLAIATLAFLQEGMSSLETSRFVNLVTASQLLNYTMISYTYLRFYKALEVQGISRESLPLRSAWQPFCSYYAMTGTLIMAIVGGYAVFLPGRWDIPTFIFSYAMIGIVPLLFVYWKVVHKTAWRKLEDITFFDDERRDVDEYEASGDLQVPSPTRLGRFWQMLWF
ncbi:general amino acid permease AGP2 [Infundibulicybe gibba]|nr:general amino acid permease AGP2 [Infundibulicybe gibba]